jgi:hypothetical protein
MTPSGHEAGERAVLAQLHGGLRWLYGRDYTVVVGRFTGYPASVLAIKYSFFPLVRSAKDE